LHLAFLLYYQHHRMHKRYPAVSTAKEQHDYLQLARELNERL